MKKIMFKVTKIGKVDNKMIEAVEILKETPKTVTRVNNWRRGAEVREQKDCRYYAYFETLPEAQSYLLEYWKGKVVVAELGLKYTRAHFEKVEALVQDMVE
jgi:hypothetical protein